jgi:hypothetical protein
MSLTAALTLAVTAALAVTGYLATYYNNLRLARRADQLDRVSRQLSELYGPLFALDAASSRLWNEFRQRQRLFWEPGDSRDHLAEAEAWRLWMATVFMPLNRRMMDVVVAHADLLSESDRMPSCLLDLCAHVAGYEPVLERWRTGEFSPLDRGENVSVVDYPAAELRSYVTAAYQHLKREQVRLLQARGVESTPKDATEPARENQ